MSFNDFTTLTQQASQVFQQQFAAMQAQSTVSTLTLVSNSTLMGITSGYNGSNLQFVGNLYTYLNTYVPTNTTAQQASALGFTTPFTYQLSVPSGASNIYVQFMNPTTGQICNFLNGQSFLILAISFPGTSTTTPSIPQSTPTPPATTNTTPPVTNSSGVTSKLPYIINPPAIVQNIATNVKQMYTVSPAFNDFNLVYNIGDFSTPIAIPSFTITNITSNTLLVVSVQAPQYFSISVNPNTAVANSFTISPKQTVIATFNFVPDATLTDSQISNFIISIFPTGMSGPVLLSS